LRKWRIRARAFLALALVLALTGTGAMPPAASAASVVVGITDDGPTSQWGYTVDPINIAVGDTITWNNQGTRLHTVTSDDGLFDSGAMRGGASFSFTAPVAGTFVYHCTFHPFIVGTINVSDGGGAPPSVPAPPSGPVVAAPPGLAPLPVPGSGGLRPPAGGIGLAPGAGAGPGTGAAPTLPGPGAPAAAAAPVARPWEGKATGVVREFQLSVGRTMWDYGGGNVIPVYAYNGQIPGPQLRVTEGDTVRVYVTNFLDAPTTIHWHGVQVPTNMDGVPGLSQDPIPPGGSFTYEFVATPAGTRWFHSHFDEMNQAGGGLTGALIIDPRVPDRPAANDEFVLVTGETTGGMGGGMGFSINGRSYPYTAPLVVQQGDRVRLRLINAGATETEYFALAGHRLTLTHSDGDPLAQPVQVDTVMLGASERADVEFIANNPGRWQLRGLGPGQADLGLAVDVVYAGYEAAAVQVPPPLDALPSFSYTSLLGPSHPTPPAQSYTMVLGSSRSPDHPWTINMLSYPGTVQLFPQAGQRIRVTYINTTDVDHPMHLHGHQVQIVGFGGQALNGPIKDTVTVHPGEQIDVEFTANNPGDWFFHCHNLEHMMGGMATEVHYR
jgi:FtsP/CotA-like multicopper oxidase with cupredoxin domain